MPGHENKYEFLHRLALLGCCEHFSGIYSWGWTFWVTRKRYPYLNEVLPECFLEWLHPFGLPTTELEDSRFPTYSPTQVLPIFTTWEFRSFSLCWVWHLLVNVEVSYATVTHLDFFFREYPLWSQMLCQFSIEFPVLFWLVLRSSLYILEIDFLWCLDITDIFSQPPCVCTFAVASLLGQWSWPTVTQFKWAEAGFEPTSVSLQTPYAFHSASHYSVLSSKRAGFPLGQDSIWIFGKEGSSALPEITWRLPPTNAAEAMLMLKYEISWFLKAFSGAAGSSRFPLPTFA